MPRKTDKTEQQEAKPAKAPRKKAAVTPPEEQAKKPAAKKKAKPRKRAPRSPDKKILAEQQKQKEEEGKRGPGRPTKLTPTIQEDVCRAIRGGSYMETAAAYAGISKDTLYAWLREGARGESPEKVAFSDAVKKAMADSEVNAVAQVISHGKETWQAMAWYLERRYRERWGRSITVNTDDLKNKTDEELLALLEETDS